GFFKYSFCYDFRNYNDAISIASNDVSRFNNNSTTGYGNIKFSRSMFISCCYSCCFAKYRKIKFFCICNISKSTTNNKPTHSLSLHAHRHLILSLCIHLLLPLHVYFLLLPFLLCNISEPQVLLHMSSLDLHPQHQPHLIPISASSRVLNPQQWHGAYHL